MSIDASSAGGPEHGRDRRKRLTRHALRRATLELGLEHGLASVSVEAIAERAGVSTRTFFNYFETKEDAALLELFWVGEAELSVLAEGSPNSAWHDLTQIFVDDVERATGDSFDFPGFLALQEQNPVLAGRQLAVFARFEARISEAMVGRLGHDTDSVSTGIDGPDAPMRASMMVGCCLTAVRVALHQWARGSRRGPVGPHVHRALGLVAPAFEATHFPRRPPT